MLRIACTIIVAALGFAPLAPSAVPDPVPAWLDPADRDALENAKGFGMARAAESHALPGPRHALEFAEPLGIDAAQRGALERLVSAMRDDALVRGAEVLAAERALDAELGSPQPDPARVAALSEAAGTARGRLRAVHLNTHVAAARVLDPAQRARYVALRAAAR